MALTMSAISLHAAAAATHDARGAPHRPVYGSNAAAAGSFEHDGVKLYFEVYGQGPPLLVIHGNGASIWSMKHQIEYFSRHYRVIAMDSRDHGRSADTTAPLTFEAMADDLAALLDHLNASPALVLGWSDGGIEALLLGLRHPRKVLRIVAMAANLRPDGLAPELLAVQGTAPAATDSSRTLTRAERVEALARNEPHIDPDALRGILAPTLIMAGDHDLIADEHTLEIYHHLPNAQLAIFPNATHMLPVDDPDRFNAAVERFFRGPFAKLDRLADLERSISRLKADYARDSAAGGVDERQ
jgi:pimeloyl-ACP methyl ester carboxylesterase